MSLLHDSYLQLPLSVQSTPAAVIESQCAQYRGTMFGNFNLNAGLSQLQDLGGRFQKIKEDLEQNIESSLRTNVAPAAGINLDHDTGNITASDDGTVALGGTIALYASKCCSCICSLQAAGTSLRTQVCQNILDIRRFVGRLQLECNPCQGIFH